MIFKTFFLLFSISLFAQERDSAMLISEVEIDAHRKSTKVLTSTKSVSVANSNFLLQNAPDRLLESVNLLPGAKMEERSPGSYRFSVRGSTLRSPFGVRNVKIYLDDFILTDASGNTYLNILDPEVIGSIEVYKGPEGGEFGSVTGGTVQLHTRTSDEMSFGISGTSFNGYKGKIRYADQVEKHKLQAYSSYQRTDSYRKQSALERQILFLKDRFRYSEKGEVGLLFLNSNLHYETPGGLTLAQMQADPRQARPKTAVLPGAQEQQAGIYNRMVLGGISHIYEFVPHLSHYISVQGSYNDFKNPFITNFEQRYERNFAVRTHLNFDKSSAANFYQTRVGFEAGTNTSRIRNFDNNGGIPGNSQNHDDLFTESGYLFLAQKAEFSARLFVDGSLSLNLMKYRWNRFFPNDFSGTKTLERELLPGFAVSYLLAQGLSVRGKISKGNSAPTMEELRSSTQEINENLYPEFGWNREVGLRKQFGNFLYLEASLFDFRLKQAIVRRQTEEGQEYFVNAGETVQRGIEAVAETKVFSFRNPVLKSLKFWFSGSFYDFKFKDYRQNENDYSGNRLTGVPKTSLQSLINLKFGNNIGLDLTHFYVSEIPLNDSNSVSADPSLVGNVTLRYPLITGDFKVNFSVSIMNVYDARYSLGHDINAFGNRFYNPAAGRNVMAGADFYFK